MRQLQTNAWPHRDTEACVHMNYYEVVKLKNGRIASLLHAGANMGKCLERTLFTCLELPLICHSQATELLCQNKAARADIPIRHPPTPQPLLPGSLEPTGVGMRRDKPMVGLHQHMSLSEASRVTDRRSSGAQWEWEQGGVRGWEGVCSDIGRFPNLHPAGLLMPTICVCNSSPTGQEPRQARRRGVNSLTGQFLHTWVG